MTLLSVIEMTASYGRAHVLHGINLEVEQGQVAVILGANGAGKTTTLRALSGMIRSAGSIQFKGREISSLSSAMVAAAGIAHVPQGRGTFADLTVDENLRVGAYLRTDDGIERDIAHWREVFPRLAERSKQQAGSLSGGEQQMLAIARALMSSPTLLLLDEPSLGLAPNTTAELFKTLERINQEIGTTMLIVEQNAHLALNIAHYASVLEAGKVVSSGAASEIQANDDVRRAYLGY